MSMTPYQEWISRPEVQAKILAGLDSLSGDEPSPPLNFPNEGICSYLKYNFGPVRHEMPNEYFFIAEQSDRYGVFDKADADLKGTYRWDGERGEFRREWCKNMAAALRADPSLWLKEGE